MHSNSLALIISFVTLAVLQTLAVPTEKPISSNFQNIAIPKVTEPAWVTNLLGPITTTEKPSFGQRVRDTAVNVVKNVQSAIIQVPERITNLIKNINRGTVELLGPKRNSTGSGIFAKKYIAGNRIVR